ncbi:glycoside hydrolase family 76 protein [Bacteroides sp. 224]|uniref:glycoside hydrolase family 76 protein n=1 Tax=Bacteroides sp. 224 TaxID=2302936 RepID=UPI0013D0C2BC|nr:glycoside hydrolase family 76 protein [Bacteroides sp. 224]NDV63674.1 alpha-1,6-mannanase [Bacteroides sp. 224]
MKTKINLFILCLLAVVVYSSCSDDDKDTVGYNDPVRSNIAPVGSFSVEATHNENELMVRWKNPANADLAMVELSYREAGTIDTRATFDPGHIIFEATRDTEVEYLLTVPYYAFYEVTVVAINKAGKRSVPESKTVAPFTEKKDEEEVQLPEMLGNAHSLMTTVIGYYFGKTSRSCWQSQYPKGGGYWDGDAVVWGQGGGLSAFVAMRKAAMETEVENIYAAMDNMMFKGIQNFYCTDRGKTAYSCYPASGNERFYDDNVWIALDMLDWFTMTNELRYMTQAKAIWTYLMDYGWDETCAGGIHWKELNEPSKSKHTCSTAPAAVLGCKLYLATGQQEYLDGALKCYNWLMTYMQDPTDHLFWDNARPGSSDPNTVGDIEKNKYSYNSGQPLQAACLLYKITNDQKYLDDAYEIAKAIHAKWFMPYKSAELKTSFNILSPGHAWFYAIMSRGFFELYSIDNNRKYVNDIEKTMLHAWSSSCHQANNLLNDDDLRGGTSKSSWEILHQGALVEMLARLALLERENR